MVRSDFFPLLALIVAQLIGLALIGYGVRQMMHAHQSKSWPAVNGIVEASYISEEYDDSANLYYDVTVRYRYTVRSTDYSGDSFSAGSHAYSDKDEADAVISRYPKGQVVQVFYDPETPRISSLEPGKQRGGWISIVAGTFFSGLSALFLWLVFFKAD